MFVEKTIAITASASNVWEVLTKRELTREWASAFSGGADFSIESDWEFGSPVLWKDQDGTTLVEGAVTALEPMTLLRFTVFDVRSEKPVVTEEDGSTYELTEQNGTTTLRLRQGDFSGMADAETYHRLSAAIWDRVLPKIKELAERL